MSAFAHRRRSIDIRPAGSWRYLIPALLVAFMVTGTAALAQIVIPQVDPGVLITPQQVDPATGLPPIGVQQVDPLSRRGGGGTQGGNQAAPRRSSGANQQAAQPPAATTPPPPKGPQTLSVGRPQSMPFIINGIFVTLDRPTLSKGLPAVFKKVQAL